MMNWPLETVGQLQQIMDLLDQTSMREAMYDVINDWLDGNDEQSAPDWITMSRDRQAQALIGYMIATGSG